MIPSTTFVHSGSPCCPCHLQIRDSEKEEDVAESVRKVKGRSVAGNALLPVSSANATKSEKEKERIECDHRRRPNFGVIYTRHDDREKGRSRQRNVLKECITEQRECR